MNIWLSKARLLAGLLRSRDCKYGLSLRRGAVDLIALQLDAYVRRAARISLPGRGPGR